jgi:hypothetical protein
MNLPNIRQRSLWPRIAVTCLATFVLASGAIGGPVTLRNMIGDPRYWPPSCNADPCVLTGLGGVTEVWKRHVDENLALGRRFVVRGLCASACEIAAQRARARLLPGARLVVHTPSPAVLS